MLPRFPIRALTLASLLPVFGAFGARPAAAQDGAAPQFFNRLTTDCLGTLTDDTAISTGTPNIQIAIQDSGSGLRFGRKPHVGGANARAGTKMLLHMDGNFTDASSLGNNGSGQLAPTACGSGNGFSGVAGDNCWDFDGVDDGIRVLKSASLADTTDQITIQAWINPDTLATSQPVVEFNDNTTPGVHLYHSVGSAGNVYVNMVGTSGASNVIQSTGGFVNTGVWQMLTVTYAGAGVRLYFNDTLVASGTLGINEPLDVNKNLWIGRRPSAALFFNGKIDEVRVLRAGLTAEDVAADYYSGTLEISTSGLNGTFTKRNLSGADYTPASPSEGRTAVTTATVNGVAFKAGAENALRWMIQDRTGNTNFTVATIDINESPPSAPLSLAGAAGATTAIDWSWNSPSQICLAAGGGPALYQVVDENAVVVSGPDPDKTDLAFAETGLSINTAYRRRVRAVDAFGTGSLAAEKTVYTRAAVPTGLGFSGESTGSVAISWGAAGNPGYTRYEVQISSDNFVSFVATLASVSDNFTATAIGASGLSANTVYNTRVRAKNGRDEDSLGILFTSFLTGSFTTKPDGPTSLSATPQGISSITWSWAAVPTATNYRLENSDTGIAIVEQAGTSFTQTGLATNVRVNAKLRADNVSGQGLFGPVVSAFTHAAAPTGTTVVSAGSSTVSISWNTASNPAGTVFQAEISTSTSFTVITQTISVTANNGSFTNLLPATPYAARVRAVNTGGVPSAFGPAVQTQTTQFVGISSQATPSSPYTPVDGGVAVFHFDESSGTAVADSSGLGNHGTLSCQFVNCSTPTFTGGMSGLGNAVQFAGIQDTLCRVGSKASLETTGSVTVSAWVRPDPGNQIFGAGIVSKGSGTFESYALEAVTNRWQFRIRDSGGSFFTIQSTMTLVPNAWTFVAGVFSPTTLHLYVNGVQTSSAAIGGTGVRFADSHDLTIGSRQSGSGPYDLAFKGSIDEVQIQNRASSPAEILAAYQGAFPGVFTPPAPNGDKSLIIPPDTFGQQAVILISGEPQNSPIIINSQILTDGLASPPTGQTFVPGSVVEVVANVNGSAFKDTLNSSVTLSIPYPDADNNQLVDGTNPALPVGGIVMYTLNEAVVRWEPLPTTIDTVNKRANGVTTHFSIFALFAPTAIQADVNTVRVYPNPWRPQSGSAFDSTTHQGKTGLAFDNLSASGFIRIFTLSGELVVTVPYSGFNGGTAIWDGRNASGAAAASGVYFAYVKGDDGSTAIKKFAVQR